MPNSIGGYPVATSYDPTARYFNMPKGTQTMLGPSQNEIPINVGDLRVQLQGYKNLWANAPDQDFARQYEQLILQHPEYTNPGIYRDFTQALGYNQFEDRYNNFMQGQQQPVQNSPVGTAIRSAATTPAASLSPSSSSPAPNTPFGYWSGKASSQARSSK